MASVKKDKMTASNGEDAGRFVVNQDGGFLMIKMTLRGRTPLLMNAMSAETLLELWYKTKAPKTAARPTPLEAADAKVYRLPNGNPHIPLRNVMSCLIQAGQLVRLDGRRQVSTADSTLMAGMLTIMDSELPLFHPGTDNPATWVVDMQQGINPNGGEAVCIIRPRFDEWEFRATISINQNYLPLTLAHELVEKAGIFKGLGDARPQCKQTYGTFFIALWEPQIV